MFDIYYFFVFTFYSNMSESFGAPHDIHARVFHFDTPQLGFGGRQGASERRHEPTAFDAFDLSRNP